jgi:hypothetical protein
VRSKLVGFALLSALGIAVTSVTGQEDPLPAVQSRYYSSTAMNVVLEVEPIRQVQQPSLADAVRRNDFLTFEALYNETRPPEYRTLHELWSWAISDPIGAFYGRDMYERLARAYPGYASYIAEYRIVDDRGNVFYPTSETRQFLLQRAIEKESPRTRLADLTPRSASETATPSSTGSSERSRTRNTSPRSTTASRRTATPTVTASKQPSVKPASAPVVNAPAATAVASAPASQPAVAVPTTITPDSAVEPAAPTPVVADPVADPVQITATPETAQPVTTTPQPAAAPKNVRTPNSGILLLVIGLIGVGLLALILRTPREVQPTSILQPPAAPPATPTEVKPAASVEPLRRPASKGDPEKPRATGSHG